MTGVQAVLGVALALLVLIFWYLISMCKTCYVSNVDNNDTICGPSRIQPRAVLRLGLCGAHSLKRHKPIPDHPVTAVRAR